MPCAWFSAVRAGRNTEGTHGERAGDGVKADVDLVHEVGRVADAHERAALVDVVLPAVELVVALEGEPEALVLGLDEQAVRRGAGSGSAPVRTA
jgi:hypothetical protein